MQESQSPTDGAKRRILSAFFAGAIAVSTQIADAAKSPPTIRILVGDKNERQTLVQGFDVAVYEATSKKLLHRNSHKAKIQIQCNLNGTIRIGTPEGRTLTSTKEPIRFESPGGFIRVGGNQFRNTLFIHNFNAECVVVNHVDLEKYVAGVLNSEMNSSWSLATLKAQAIAARTYALHQMRENSTLLWKGLKAPFDLGSDIKDQVYEGAHRERYKTVRAVEETRGQVLAYEDRPIKAFYHSTCGGHTEATAAVWGVNYAYIRPVRCGFCTTSPRYTWTYSLPVFDLLRALNEKGFFKKAFTLAFLQKPFQETIQSIQVQSVGETGRARMIDIETDAGKIQIHSTRLRSIIGGSFIRSTDFSVFRLGNSVQFSGRGYGHGVGLCQWGARTMGDRGFSAKQILAHYYPLTTISKIY